jgi:hypothetical protein
MSAASVDIGDFENDPSLTTNVTIHSAAPTANAAVYLVTVGTSQAGSLRLQVKPGAVLTDLAGNELNTTSALSDDTTIVVNPEPELVCQLGVLDPKLANGGINPATGNPWAVGDKYRLIFVTSEKTTFSSTDIATYNTFVQGLANAAGLGTSTLGSVTWKAVGSTATVAARNNTGTNPDVNGPGEPILRMDGTFVIATNYADLWNGIYITHVAGQNYLGVHLDENRVEKLDDRVFTGSGGDGLPSGTQVFGSGGNIQTGRNYAPASYNSLDATSWMQDWRATGEGRVYAISQPLTVQNSTNGGNFADWIANPSFNIDPELRGFGTDADADGLPNGIEAWFGTNPGLSSTGLTSTGKSGSVFTFQHPSPSPLLSNVSGSYEWSIDLSAWYAAGTVGSTTVAITATPGLGVTTVEADTADSAVPPTKFFIRCVAREN